MHHTPLLNLIPMYTLVYNPSPIQAIVPYTGNNTSRNQTNGQSFFQSPQDTFVAKAQDDREKITTHLRRLTTEMTQLRNENFYYRNTQGQSQN